jgi:hypothetical protein
MIPVRPDSVVVDFDNAKARLKVSGLNVFDDNDIANSLTQGLGLPSPPIPPVFPVRARVWFDIEWNGVVEMAQINNASEGFKGTFSRPTRLSNGLRSRRGLHLNRKRPILPEI